MICRNSIVTVLRLTVSVRVIWPETRVLESVKIMRNFHFKRADCLVVTNLFYFPYHGNFLSFKFETELTFKALAELPIRLIK